MNKRNISGRVCSQLSLAMAGIVALFVAGCGERPAAAPKAKAPEKPGAETAVAPKPAEPTKPPEIETATPAKVSTLAAYFHFDEERGATTAADSSGGNRPGRLNDGAAAGAQGMVKSAVEFKWGRNGQIMVSSPLDLFTTNATIAAWVKRSGAQLRNATILLSRGGDTVAGLLFGAANELTYTWGKSREAPAWKSGLALPDNEWAFVALVVGPESATLYLGVPGADLREAEHKVPHEMAEFSGPLTIGRDPIIATDFTGFIDEVGIWKNSMSREEVGKLFAIGQKLAAASKAAPVAQPQAPRAAAPTQTAAAEWNDPEFTRAAMLYNKSQTEFIEFLKTRSSQATLKRIEENVHSCVAAFERCKKRAPAGVNVQGYIDMCNKLLFQIQSSRQIGP